MYMYLNLIQYIIIIIQYMYIYNSRLYNTIYISNGNTKCTR